MCAGKIIIQIKMYYSSGAEKNGFLHRKVTKIGEVTHCKARKKETLVSTDAWQMCFTGTYKLVLLPSGTTQGMIQSSYHHE